MALLPTGRYPQQAKVKAAGQSIIASTPASMVLVWIVGQFGVEIPVLVAVAIGNLIGGLVAWFTAYMAQD